MAKKKNSLYSFQLAVRGWSFSNLEGMKKRLQAGEAQVRLLGHEWSVDERKQAKKVMAVMRAAIHREEKRK